MRRDVPVRSGRLTGVAMAALVAACNPSTPSLLEKAQALEANNDSVGAALHLRTVVAREPAHGEAQFMLGSALTRTGDWTDAEAAFRRAKDLGVSASRVLPALGRVLFDLEKDKELLAEIQPASGLSPEAQTDIALLRFLRGWILVDLQKP